MTNHERILGRAPRAGATLQRAKADRSDARKTKRFVNYMVRTHRLNTDRDTVVTPHVRRAIVRTLVGLIR